MKVKVITEMIPEVEDVLNFLRDLDDGIADRVFVNNLKTLREATLERYLEHVEEYIGGSNVISSAFVWEKTPEGDKYWGLINRLWRKHWKEISGPKE